MIISQLPLYPPPSRGVDQCRSLKGTGKYVHKEGYMRKYEAIFIFQPEDEHVSQGTAIVQEEFKNSGITVLKQEDMGKKDLAYEIKKNQRGHYFCYKIETDPNNLKPIEKNLKLKSEILKFVIFKDEGK
jgi:small subunit ribosomal protein S6